MSDSLKPPWWAEASLVAVHLTVVAGFARLYDDSSFALPLVAVVISAHALASASRRAGLPGAASLAVSAIGAILVLTWAMAWSTTWWGLPTTATWSVMVTSLEVAREHFSVVVAPTEILLGFQLLTAAALWWAVWFADWTAYRLRATIEPIIPAAAIFIFCSVLGEGRAQVSSAAWFAASVLVFIATQRAMSAGRSNAPAVLTAGAVVTVLAVAAGTLVGPQLPGASQEALIAWRDGGNDDPTRITISPMVELKRRLVEQTDVLAFVVRADRPAYWRLTSLDSFDGEIWTSSGEYTEADGELDSSTDSGVLDQPLTQTFDIKALSTIWVPSAFEAREVTESQEPLRWDDESGTLIVESSAPTSDGLSYTVRSQAPTIDPTMLTAADGPSARELTQRYTKLPNSFPEVAAAQADQVVASVRDGDGNLGRYEASLALQGFFRDFEYSLDSPPGHDEDALVSFLDDRVGYCEQFAGAFAALARSLGIPARVAVGFTPGDVDPQDPELFRVRGRHAHAWPEVHFEGIGWVPFEPTPQRGIPGAQNYTGVTPQQATIGGAPPTPLPETTATAPTQPVQPEATDQTSTQDQTQTRTEAAPGDDGSGSNSGRGPDERLLVGLTAALLMALAMLARRRHLRRDPTVGPVLGADRRWARVTAGLEREGVVPPRPSETPTEYAHRVGGEIGERAVSLHRLAGLVSQARWSPHHLGVSENAEMDDLIGHLFPT